MAINLFVANFAGPVPDEPEDLFMYLGYVPEVAGTPDMNIKPLSWDFVPDLPFPIDIKIFRILEENFDIPYLTVVFLNAFPEDRLKIPGFVEGQGNLMGQVLAKIIVELPRMSMEDIENVNYENGACVYQLKTDLTGFVNDLTTTLRKNIKAVK